MTARFSPWTLAGLLSAALGAAFLAEGESPRSGVAGRSVSPLPSSSHSMAATAGSPVLPDLSDEASRVTQASADLAASSRPPLAFEPLADGAGPTRYRAYGRGYTVDLLPGEVRIATQRPAPEAQRPSAARTRGADRAPAFDLSRMVIAGARPAPLQGVGALASVSNSFMGDNPAAWRAGVPHSGRVVATGVYDGIDLVYYGNEGRLQYDFLVAPGADPSVIALGFPEASGLRLDDAGNLRVGRDGAAPLVTRAPVLFQDIDGERRMVEGRFVVDASAREVRFAIGDYDAAHTLVIDPVLEYGTFFGAVSPISGATTQPAAVGVDRFGAMYIAGWTTGELPLASDDDTGVPIDVFIAKFNASGELVYTTRYGGSGDDQARDLAVSPSGDVVVVGRTGSSDLPGRAAPGVFDSTLNGVTDGFVARFSAAGAPVWASYVGGSGGAEQFEYESLDRVLLEPSGHILVAGSVLDIGTLNGVGSRFHANPDLAPFQPPDGLVARFSGTGALVDATYVGSIEYDYINALGRSPSGAVIVAGTTASTFRTGYGVTSAAYQPTCDFFEGEDGGCSFVARLGADLRSMPAATFFGPPFEVYFGDLAVDADGSVVLTGQMGAGATPTVGAIAATANAFDTSFNGFYDAFVARVDANLSGLSALTYLGGAGDDFGQSIAIDSAGQILVSGHTTSADFPVQLGALKSTSDGSDDAFLVRFTPTLATASYLSRVGGVDTESGAVIEPGPAGRLYLLGQSGPLPSANETSPGFTVPVTSNAFRRSRAPGATEAFLYRLGPEFDSEYAVTSAPAQQVPDAVNVGQGTIIGTLNSQLTVSGMAGVLDRVEVALHITHPSRRQLRLTLLGPGGAPSVVIVPGGATVQTGTNFGSSCSARTVFTDDPAAPGIGTSAAPSAGTFRPVNPLSPFVGLTQANGTWTLRVEDLTAGPVGASQFLQCATVTLHFRRPEITAVSPSGSGVPAPNSAITIVGTNFGSNAQVRIGGRLATVTSSDATAISALVPAGVGTNPDVAVTNTDGRSAIVVDPFNRVSFTGGQVGDTVIGQAGVSDGNIVQPSLSRDGRWLAFHTGTRFMVNGDTNGVADVFVRDRGAAGGAPAIVRVSVDSNGTQANGASTRAKVSTDGRYVAFVSAASNLVPDDTNGVEDVFVHDRDADGNGVFDETGPGQRATFRVSVASTGAQANGPSGEHDLSPDGFWVAFVSVASNLVPTDTNGVRDVFLHHWPGAQTARVSVANGGGQANGPSDSPGVSAGGRRVVFASDASNLVANDANGVRDVFLFDRTDRTTSRLSTRNGTTEDANGPSDNPSIDDRGATIAFQTKATDILPALGGAGGFWQVVVLRLPTITPLDAMRMGLGLSRVGEPVVNIADALRNLISGNAQGQPGGNDSTNPAINGDGTGVAFESDGDDLTLGDSNGQPDVFVAPAEGGAPELVSVDEQGQQGNEPSQQAVISDDGSTVAFQSQAPLTPAAGNQPNQALTNVFVRGNALVVTSVTPPAVPLGGTPAQRTVTIVGSNFSNATVRFGGFAGQITNQNDSVINVVAPPSPLPQGGPVNVSITNASGEAQTVVNGLTYLASGGDADLDGLPDAWEQQFGLDPSSAAGVNGAGGDPDGDGLTNAGEFARTTHPRGTFQRFLAEGATNDTFFTTRISVANPSPSQAAIVLLRFQRADGTEVPSAFTLGPLESRKIVVNQVNGMANAEFATLVESDAQVIVDRQMWWNNQDAYGTHAEAAVKAPSLVWYLAEGATHSNFDLFYLLQNPSTTDATVKVRYLLPTGAPLEKTYLVKANSRANIWVNNEQFPNGSGNFALAATDVSAVLEVQNNVPIIVERAMYLTRGLEQFTAGHESAGVTAPSTTWFLAEGATGPLFDLFVLLANPGATDALTKVSYLLDDGRTFTQAVTVKANSRQTLWVDFETPDDGPAGVLNGPSLSTKVEVQNGVPIIVERAMWWPGGPAQWYEAHNSPGSTVTGTLWGLADGALSGPPLNVSTYILLANTDSTDTANVTITLLYDDGPGTPRTFSVSRSSRKTINVAAEFPEAAGREFGALVESVNGSGGGPVPIVVERALYNDARGLFLAGGNNQLATRLQ